ncbi:MAG: uracil-DNA glycosylase [Bacillota bacterium]
MEGKADRHWGLAWRQLEEEARSCRACRLRDGCQGVVVADGIPTARLMLVGEAPGRTEDEQGRPFVGAAGQLLDRILDAAALPRPTVYITNVVKCRPPQNRLPQWEEVEACRPWLERQVQLVDPAIIVCLGALAAQALIHRQARITQWRGQWYEKDGRWYLPTYHPAALLRDKSKWRPVWDDFREIRRRYDQLAR